VAEWERSLVKFNYLARVVGCIGVGLVHDVRCLWKINPCVWFWWYYCDLL